jgi:DNA-binding response OmpR family regulator
MTTTKESQKDRIDGLPMVSGRVLIVDDEVALAGLLKDELEQRGYEVETASTAAAGMQKWRERVADILILDYNLPDRLGDELLVEICQEHPCSTVIMMTGDPNPGLAAEWFSKGASGYLQKPFEIEHLVRLCERNRRERALGVLPAKT